MINNSSFKRYFFLPILQFVHSLDMRLYPRLNDNVVDLGLKSLES